MRANRTYGSEGGEASPSRPLSTAGPPATAEFAGGARSQCARKRTHTARWKSVSGQAKAS